MLPVAKKKPAPPPMVALASSARAENATDPDAMLAQMGGDDLPPAVLEKYGPAIEALEQYAPELVSASALVTPASTPGAPPVVDVAAVEGTLPPVVLQAVDATLPGITLDEASEIALHLAAEGYLSELDSDAVATLLVALAARNASADNPPQPGENVDEDFAELTDDSAPI